MSVAKLSQTLQVKILDNLINNTIEEINRVQATVPTKKIGGKTKEIEVTSANATRLLTDPNQTGVFSREGLQGLASGFKSIVESGGKTVGSRVLSADGNISKQPGYPKLKQYLGIEILKSSKPEIEALREIVQNLAAEADKILSSDNLYESFLDYLSATGYDVEEENSDVFIVSSIPHGTLNLAFADYLSSILQVKPHLVEFISANTDAGHLLGIFNQKIFRRLGGTVDDSNYGLGELSASILSNIDANTEEDKKAIEKLNNTFSSALNLLELSDFLSSQIKNSPEIFLKLSKEVYLDLGNPKAAVEIQMSLDNSAIGRQLTAVGRALESLITAANQDIRYITIPGTTQQQKNPKSIDFAKKLEGIFKSIGSLSPVLKEMAQSLKAAENKLLNDYVDNILSKVENIAEVLANAEGSDSVIKSIEKTFVAKLSGATKPSKSTTAVSKTQKAKSKKQSTIKIAKPKINIATKKAANISAVKRVRRRTPAERPAPANLVNLLNATLHDQIRKNMGTGDRRDVLNYRTGRFATSVKVERVSESRMGMITAFYTYMKNPYATFSAGGRQEFPRSRDPKILISKSIREIASTLVTNQLRAVNV